MTAFASTNLGDVSPNIAGPICTNTGLACDVTTSTCEGEAQFCIASGPGEDMFESTKIIAERMYSKALVNKSKLHQYVAIVKSQYFKLGTTKR